MTLRGYADQALKQMQDAVTLARELDHPFTLAAAQTFSLSMSGFLRNSDAIFQQVEPAMAYSAEHVFPLLIAIQTIVNGWALALTGKHAMGVSRTKLGVEILQAIGFNFAITHFLSLHADAYAEAGMTSEAMTIIDKALTMLAAGQFDDRTSEAELHRIKGQLLLHAGSPDAEASLWIAISIARQQGAKLYELRAITSLCRLWRRQGKRDQARQMLSEIYGWFTEGFDTPDLKEGKALLAELS